MKKFLVLVLAIIIAMGAFTTSASALRISEVYEDIREDMWYAGSIRNVYEAGLMTGVTENTFGPSLPITRGMIATIMYRMYGEPTVGSCKFTDVAKGSYYENAIAWASECGITNGVSATEFAPDVSITREQLVTLFYRYYKFLGKDMSVRFEDKPLTIYNDHKQISSYAREAVKWATDMSMVIGDNGNFNPQGIARRDYTAFLLDEFSKRIKNMP